MRTLLMLGGTVLLAWSLAASSGVQIGWHPPTVAELRLSWSARPERLETCRRLSDAEYAARPAHMRQRVECEGRTASYLLTVTVDGRLVDSTVVTGGGLRHDRPIFLVRGFDVVPGERRVQVVFARRESAGLADGDDAEAATESGGERRGARAGDEMDEPSAERSAEGIEDGRAREAREARQRAGRRLAALPPRLELARVVTFRGGEAVLVTVERGALVLRTP